MPRSGFARPRIWILLAAGLILIPSWILIRGALQIASKQLAVQPTTAPNFDRDSLIGNLGSILRIESVAGAARADGTQSESNAGRTQIAESLLLQFPLLHAQLIRREIGTHGLLFTWGGRNAQAPGVILAAHFDVVPAGDVQAWTQAPFAGAVADGYAWGRGTLDNKSSGIAILTAVEHLLSKEFVPPVPIYLAFGFDEEIGGHNGAKAIAEYMRDAGIAAEFALDEGGVLAQGIIDGLDAPVALIGIDEKRSLQIELKVGGQGGHASLSGGETAIGVLSKALVRIESNPFDARLSESTRRMLETCAAEMSFAKRLILGNLDIFSPLVTHQLAGDSSTASSVRTTAAITMIAGGTAPNALPSEARAGIDLRLLPDSNAEDVIASLLRSIDDPRVQLIAGDFPLPGPTASIESSAYQTIAATIRAVFPEAIVSPYMTPGATDVRHYAGVAKDLYRFLPIPMEAEDLKRLHGVDERIALGDLAAMVHFYVQLIQQLDTLDRGE